jgi:hypothetical protein
LEQNAVAAEAHRLDLARLEEDAPELVGHTDFILSNIQKSRDDGRRVTPSDIVEFITDVLEEFFVDSRVERHPTKSDVFEISLSTTARASLAAFVENIARYAWTSPVEFSNRLINSVCHDSVSRLVADRPMCFATLCVREYRLHE